MPDRTKAELETLLAKITGVEGQTERAEAIRAKLAEMETDETED